MNREFFHKDFFAINQDHEASEFPLKPSGLIQRLAGSIGAKDPYGGWVRGCRLRSFWLWVIVMSATYADLSDKVVLVWRSQWYRSFSGAQFLGTGCSRLLL